jgi:hypothetical protein
MKLSEYLKQFEKLDPDFEVVLNDLDNNGESFSKFVPFELVYSDDPNRENPIWSEFKGGICNIPVILLP